MSNKEKINSQGQVIPANASRHVPRGIRESELSSGMIGKVIYDHLNNEMVRVTQKNLHSYCRGVVGINKVKVSNGYENKIKIGYFSTVGITQSAIGTTKFLNKELQNKIFTLCDGCRKITERSNFLNASDVGLGAIQRANKCLCHVDTQQFSYHHMDKPFLSNSLFTWGFEIEKEDEVKDDYNASRLLRETGWVLEDDCSLDDCIGYELVSPALPVSTPRLVKELKNPAVSALVNGETSERCGGHFHLSVAMDNDNIRDNNQFLSVFQPLIWLIAALFPDRADNEFSQIGYVELTCNRRTSGGISADDTDDYPLFLECRGDRHFEFRSPDSPTDTKDLVLRAKLIELMTKSLYIGKTYKEIQKDLRKILDKMTGIGYQPFDTVIRRANSLWHGYGFGSLYFTN